MEKTVQVRLKIKGHVQGVFFRHSTKQKAQELSLSGWVQNADDGTVEILASGTSEFIESFIAWCHKGPTRARVEQVVVEWLVDDRVDCGYGGTGGADSIEYGNLFSIR